MIEDDPGVFCVVEQDCDQCHASGVVLNRVTSKPMDGGDWDTRIVLCERCLENLRDAISERLSQIAFSRRKE